MSLLIHCASKSAYCSQNNAFNPVPSNKGYMGPVFCSGVTEYREVCLLQSSSEWKKMGNPCSYSPSIGNIVFLDYENINAQFVTMEKSLGIKKGFCYLAPSQCTQHCCGEIEFFDNIIRRCWIK